MPSERFGALLMTALILAFALAIAGPALAEPSGREIMNRVDKDHRAADEKAQVIVVIYAASGNRRQRDLEMFFKSGEGEDDKSLFRFTSPGNVAGTAVLTIEQTGRDDDQWAYLPALRKAKRIASSGRTGSFAGTDFAYEDLRTEQLDRHDYRLLRTETYRDEPCYVVEATPKDDAKRDESGYSKRLVWVTTATFLVYKVEFHDRGGHHLKTLLNGDYQKVDGRWRMHQSEMKNVRDGTKTLMKFTSREIESGLPDRLFTKAELER